MTATDMGLISTATRALASERGFTFTEYAGGCWQSPSGFYIPLADAPRGVTLQEYIDWLTAEDGYMRGQLRGMSCKSCGGVDAHQPDCRV